MFELTRFPQCPLCSSNLTALEVLEETSRAMQVVPATTTVVFKCGARWSLKAVPKNVNFDARWEPDSEHQCEHATHRALKAMAPVVKSDGSRQGFF